MTNSTYSPEEARAALASAQLAQRKLAANMTCPPWRHAAFGAVMGLLVTGMGFSGGVQAACTAAAMAILAWIFQWDRKRYGVFINGYRKGATFPFTIALVAVMLGLMLLQIWLREQDAGRALHLIVGAAAMAVGTVASVIWTRIFRREMGAAR